MTTTIGGLRARSFAPEHVSDNIANSQTIGFKRTETNFLEAVSESTPKQRGSGVVIANSRATNAVRGDIRQSDVDTRIAINGDGYFVVEQQAGLTDRTARGLNSRNSARQRPEHYRCLSGFIFLSQDQAVNS